MPTPVIVPLKNEADEHIDYQPEDEENAPRAMMPVTKIVIYNGQPMVESGHVSFPESVLLNQQISGARRVHTDVHLESHGDDMPVP